MTPASKEQKVLIHRLATEVGLPFSLNSEWPDNFSLQDAIEMIDDLQKVVNQKKEAGCELWALLTLEHELRVKLVNTLTGKPEEEDLRRFLAASREITTIVRRAVWVNDSDIAPG